MYSKEKMDTRARRRERDRSRSKEKMPKRLSKHITKEGGKEKFREKETTANSRKRKRGEKKQMNKKEPVERINLRRLPLRRCFPVVHARDFPPPLHGAISNKSFIYSHFFTPIRVAFNQVAISTHGVSVLVICWSYFACSRFHSETLAPP